MGPSLHSVYQLGLPARGSKHILPEHHGSPGLQACPSGAPQLSMLTFQSISNQSLQFAQSFHPVLLSEMQTQPPGFLNMKHSYPRSVAERRLTFYSSSLGLVTGSQAKLSLKVSSPNVLTIPCTLLELTIKSVGCHTALNGDGAPNPRGVVFLLLPGARPPA